MLEKKSPAKILANIYLAICWSWLVLVLTTVPTSISQEEPSHIVDKIVHMVLFGGFAYLVSNIFVGAKQRNLKYIVSFSLLLAMSYAALTEYAQIYIPGRSASDLDLLAGIIGAVLSQIIFYVRLK